LVKKTIETFLCSKFQNFQFFLHPHLDLGEIN